MGSSPDDLIAKLDGEEKTYLRRRALLDGPKKTGLRFVQDLAGDLSPEAELFDNAVARKSDISRVALNTISYLAVCHGHWETADILAREVVARDHHDLTAQRIIDAANEQSSTLETEVDRWLATRTCPAPFRQIETRANRSVHICCSAWQPIPIGRIDDADGEPFWTSRSAEEIRRSVTEGDFSHCSRWHCPAIAARRLPEANPQSEAKRAAAITSGPARVILSHDRSCNISCPSCRKKLILMDHAASARLDTMFETNLLPYLEAAEEIKVTGSGDPFGSRHFRRVLEHLCSQGQGARIQLHTNGLLANERAWNDLGLWGQVLSVWVSIDAAHDETYQEVRRGGTFEQLLPALHFLGSLKRAGEIETFRLDFVVQARNYDEMGDFVDLAQRVGADRVYFLRLRNWGNQTAEEFRGMDVCSPEHPENHRLLERLRDPRLEQVCVDLGSLTDLKKASGPARAYA